MRLIDADALLEAIENLGKGGMPIAISKNYIQEIVNGAPTIQREEQDNLAGWVSAKDTLALDAARKIMFDVNTMTIPVDVKRMSQLQAKIQVVISELISAAPTYKE